MAKLDANQVLRLLDDDDSASVRSFSSECLDLLDSNESTDEEVQPKSKVFPM